ncbi:gliding motility lipoprotein GldB [Cellulophaga fucicola]|uniref:gliding motility lipoprotein GldB n=1 Tax=Cellulophaga fucicola TaxID=76595 RepID=UPI003EBDEBB4
MRQPFYILFFVFTLFLSCKQESKEAKEIAKVTVALDISRFDREIADAKPADIPALKEKYPYLFPSQYPDSIWVDKLRDTLQISLLKEVNSTFGDFKKESQDLKMFYQHVKYFFPEEVEPKVVTVISDVNYNSPVILTNKLLLLGLDNYLGSDHKFYQGLQNYIAEGLDKKYLITDIANAYAKKVVPYPTRDRTFLGQLVYYGKELYVKDKLIPFVTDAEKIKYSQEDLDWAFVNEEQIWRNYIQNQYLYSTDKNLNKRFLDPAPFSKFQLELDSESPGRLGRFLGWQIVRSFMNNNEVTLQQMLNLSAEEIFKKSNYKPKR